MNKECHSLYRQIQLSYGNAGIRENEEMSQMLLTASNQLIRSENVSLVAARLNRQLDLYLASHALELPQAMLVLKQKLQVEAQNYRVAKVPSVMLTLFGFGKK